MSKVNLPTVLSALAEAQMAEDEHLTVEILADYQDGLLDEAEAERVVAHLAVCPQCMQLWESLNSETEAGQIKDDDFELNPRAITEGSKRQKAMHTFDKFVSWAIAASLLCALIMVLYEKRNLERALIIAVESEKEIKSQLNDKVPIHDLFPSSSTTRGAGDIQLDQFEKGAKLIHLIIHSDDVHNYPSYSIKIKSLDTVVWQKQFFHQPKENQGFVTLLLPTEELKRDDIVLYLYGYVNGEEVLLNKYIYP